MNYTTLFTDFEDLRRYAEGLQADTPYEELHPSLRTAGAEIVRIITAPVYSAIAAFASDQAASQEQLHALDLLKTAMAAGAQFRYQVFQNVKRNGSEQSLYKYQHEELKEHYQSAYWTALDSLLEWLDANGTTGGWSQSEGYRTRQALPVKSAAEFNRYYGIDGSCLFFSKIIYILRQTWSGTVLPVVRGSLEDDAVMEAARTALCYLTMAKAVMQFDIAELPRSIRWDYSHEFTRGSQTQERARLHNELRSQGQAALDKAQGLIRASSGLAAVHNHNRESDKFYSTL